MEGTRRSSDCRWVCVRRGVPKGCSLETGADIGGCVDGSKPRWLVCVGFDMLSGVAPLLPYANESLDGTKESVPAAVVPEATWEQSVVRTGRWIFGTVSLLART